MLCMLVSWNLPYGPDKDHYRKGQLDDALSATFVDSSAAASPLFMKHCSGIIDALARNGVELPGEASPEEEAWQLMQQRKLGRTAGYRVNLCRFCGSLAKAIKETQWWEVDAYIRTYLALETDMLGNAALIRKLRLKVGAAEAVEEGGGSTAAARLTLEDRGELRACTQNADA